MSEPNFCSDCGEPLRETTYTYPYKGVMHTSKWCDNCDDWKPDPLLPATRRIPKVGDYKE